MIYICDLCGYMFEAGKDSTFCPDCGKRPIRPATESEAHDFYRLRKELQQEAWWLKPPLRLFQTEGKENGTTGKEKTVQNLCQGHIRL